MNFGRFCGAGRAAYNFIKPTIKNSSFINRMIQNESKSILLRTMFCSGNNLVLQNLRELLEKKTKQSTDLESLLSLVMGQSFEQSNIQVLIRKLRGLPL